VSRSKKFKLRTIGSTTLYSRELRACSSARPGVGELDAEFRFANGQRISGSDRLKTGAEIVDDVEIAVGAEGIAQADVGAGGFGLGSVGLEKCGEVEETRECVTNPQAGKRDIDISLWQAKDVQRVVEREAEIGVRPVLRGGRGGLERSGVIGAPAERTCVGEASGTGGSVRKLMKGETITAGGD